MADKKLFIEDKWYFQGFNAVPNFIQHGPKTAINGMWAELGYGHTKHLFLYEGNYLEYGYNVGDMINTGKRFFEELEKDPGYTEKIKKRNDELLEMLWIYQKKYHNLDLTKLSVEELFEHYKKTTYMYQTIISVGHVIEGISFVSEDQIKKQLFEMIKKKNKEAEFKHYITTLLQPVRSSFANEEQTSLNSIIHLVRKDKVVVQLFKSKSAEEIEKEINPEIKKELDKHARKYFSLENNYYRTQVLAAVDFVRKIKTIVEEENFEKLKEVNYGANKKAKTEMLDELKANKEFRKLINISEIFMHWQDDRKHQMLTALHYQSNALEEISKRKNVDFDLCKWLLPYEVVEENFTKEMAEELKARSTKSVFTFLRTSNNQIDIDVYVGKEAQQIIDEVNQKRHNIKSDELTGTCASTGKVVGKVRICKTVEDIKQFQDNEVLVAPMTRPEYVPIMKKSIGIITDEGGLTCHAAIVSRELGIPCVIGTNVGTKILHNGDIVEVNADHGRIKILERA